MIVLRAVLAVHLAVLLAYTATVISNHGWDLMPVFFGDIAIMAWPGQFNLDFMGFLMLSALWTAWRNQFSVLGLVLGVVALFGGMAFLAIYLLVLSLTVRSVLEMLVGQSDGH